MANQTVGNVSVTPSFDMNSIVKEGQSAQQAGTSTALKAWEEGGFYDQNSKKPKLTQFMNQYNTAYSGVYQ